MIKILIGGSPCTHWSVAQNNNRETEPSGIGWELFKNYKIARDKFKPDFFLYENNKSAAQPIKDKIAEELGVELMYINSALVSAQSRERLYVFNWDIKQPIDRKIMLKDVIELPPPQNTREPVAVNLQVVGRKRNADGIFERSWEARKDGKASTLTSIESRRMVAIPIKGITADHNSKKNINVTNGHYEANGKLYPIRLSDGYYEIRALTVEECCRLQTLPESYCNGVPKTHGHKGLANGWTAEVIIHILNGALGNIDRHEKIVVLSMYDGIGTGRYCLDKMGFTNVEYHAYEIDEAAMKIANGNYPDIIQHGDAFQVRNADWIL